MTVPFVPVRLFETLENGFAVVDAIGKVGQKEAAQLQVIDGAALHRLKIEGFVDVLPVDDAAQFFPEHQVEPDAHGAPVALHKRVSDVHLHVLGGNLLKRIFGHFFNGAERFLQIKTDGEAEIAPGDVERANLPGEIVQPAEQGLVDLPQPRDGTDLDVIDVTALVKTAGVRRLFSSTSFILESPLSSGVLRFHDGIDHTTAAKNAAIV